jgi:hypothetical protein
MIMMDRVSSWNRAWKYCISWVVNTRLSNLSAVLLHMHACTSSQYAPRRSAVRVDELDGEAMQVVQPWLHTFQHQPFQGNDLLHAIMRSAMHEHGMHTRKYYSAEPILHRQCSPDPVAQCLPDSTVKLHAPFQRVPLSFDNVVEAGTVGLARLRFGLHA